MPYKGVRPCECGARDYRLVELRESCVELVDPSEEARR